MDADNALNPYRSPESAITQPWLVFGNPEDPWFVTPVLADWRFRRVWIEGPLTAGVEWDARWPREVVRINQRRMAAHCPFWYAPHFAFTLESPHRRYDVTVAVTMTLWERLTLFRISIDGETIYEEPDSSS